MVIGNDFGGDESKNKQKNYLYFLQEHLITMNGTKEEIYPL